MIRPRVVLNCVPVEGTLGPKGMGALVSAVLKKAFRDENTLVKASSKDRYGIYFEKTGKEIKEGCLKKAAELRKKLEQITGSKKDKPQFGENLGILVSSEESALGESTTQKDWRVSVIEGQIATLEAIARNIKEKQTFCLSEWDLDKLGL